MQANNSTPNNIANRSDAASIWKCFIGFRWKILATWFLVVVEAGLMLLFPLLLGIAVDSLLQQSLAGLWWLGLVGIAMIVVGAVRRLYDTRLYSRVYRSAAEQIVRQERDKNADVSVISARTGMVTELVEFLETSFPAIVECVVGIVGTLVMIWLLQAKVFASCLAATGIVIVIYLVTQQRTYRLNQGANDESEKSVHVLTHGTISDVAAHFRRRTQWNIRLSDLETFNFSLSGFAMIAVLLFAVVATIQGGVTDQGKVLAILMYVFGYIESVLVAPLFYQQYIRLQEISRRLLP